MNPPTQNKKIKCNEIYNDQYRNLCSVVIQGEDLIQDQQNPEGLSGIRDLDRIILNELGDQDLANICVVNKYTYSLCQDEIFWRARVLNRFGPYLGSADYIQSNYLSGTSWKMYYLWLISSLHGFLYDVEVKARKNKREDILKLISIMKSNNNDLFNAIKNVNIENVKKILKRRLLIPEEQLLTLINQPETPERIEILKLLLEDERTNPSFARNLPILIAITNNNMEEIKLLFNHKNFDKKKNINKLLMKAVEFENVGLVKLLLELEHIDPTVFSNKPIRNAILTSNKELIEVFRNNPKSSHFF